MFQRSTAPTCQPVILWLFTCCAMITFMVFIGGLTRLTESGLSIVEWKPVTGVIPPLTTADWMAEFAKYQQTPEYIKVNSGMSLEAFKNIFYLEYFHRLAGRLTGLIFFIPLVIFSVRRQISWLLAKKLSVIFLLGALQGVIGWYMVKSGLKDRPDVSQYRLALHLATAFLLYGLVLWTGLSLWFEQRPFYRSSLLPAVPYKKLASHTFVITALIFIQVILGALVAGLDAGLIYNTFPLMGDRWIPSDIAAISPFWRNLFENVATVQFTHRVMAYVITIAITAFYLRTRKIILPSPAKSAVTLLLFMVFIQIALGISALLLQVPIALASIHQLGALALFTAALLNSFIFWKLMRQRNNF